MPASMPSRVMREHYTWPWEGPLRDARYEFGAAIMDQGKHLCGKMIPASLSRAVLHFWPFFSLPKHDQFVARPNLIHPADRPGVCRPVQARCAAKPVRCACCGHSRPVPQSRGINRSSGHRCGDSVSSSIPSVQTAGGTLSAPVVRIRTTLNKEATRSQAKNTTPAKPTRTRTCTSTPSTAMTRTTSTITI